MSGVCIDIRSLWSVFYTKSVYIEASTGSLLGKGATKESLGIVHMKATLHTDHRSIDILYFILLYILACL